MLGRTQRTGEAKGLRRHVGVMATICWEATECTMYVSGTFNVELEFKISGEKFSVKVEAYPPM